MTKKHDHAPKCIHPSVTYCAECSKVYCETKDCKEEWITIVNALFNPPSRPPNPRFAEPGFPDVYKSTPPLIITLPGTAGDPIPPGVFTCSHS